MLFYYEYLWRQVTTRWAYENPGVMFIIYWRLSFPLVNLRLIYISCLVRRKRIQKLDLYTTTRLFLIISTFSQKNFQIHIKNSLIHTQKTPEYISKNLPNTFTKHSLIHSQKLTNTYKKLSNTYTKNSWIHIRKPPEYTHKTLTNTFKKTHKYI